MSYESQKKLFESGKAKIESSYQGAMSKIDELSKVARETRPSIGHGKTTNMEELLSNPDNVEAVAKWDKIDRELQMERESKARAQSTDESSNNTDSNVLTKCTSEEFYKDCVKGVTDWVRGKKSSAMRMFDPLSIINIAPKSNPDTSRLDDIVEQVFLLLTAVHNEEELQGKSPLPRRYENKGKLKEEIRKIVDMFLEPDCIYEPLYVFVICLIEACAEEETKAKLKFRYGYSIPTQYKELTTELFYLWEGAVDWVNKLGKEHGDLYLGDK